MPGVLVILLSAACSTAVHPPKSAPLCGGPVSCGREQLLEADRGLRNAVAARGPAAAFSDVLLDDAQLLAEGKGRIAGKERIAEALRAEAPFTWATARADVSQGAELGYSFGWLEKGHYAAVWRRNGSEWKLAVFLSRPAQPQSAAPPAWFVPFRGEREPGAATPKQTVAAADAAFAALAKQSDTQTAFTTYAAQDAVLFASTMIFGREAIHQLLTGAGPLDWGPIAESAAQDLGYTVGAYTRGSVRGNYLTVWRLESDGTWRYVLDGGVKG
jgi:hypothetical protein